jgi:hypothetical protein
MLTCKLTVLRLCCLNATLLLLKCNTKKVQNSANNACKRARFAVMFTCKQQMLTCKLTVLHARCKAQACAAKH